MNYGLYMSAAGALTSMHRQDVLSNNLANMNTVGFKPDAVAIRQLPSERELRGDASPRQLLEALGGVVQADDTRPSLRQGELISVRSPLDLAIEGDGFFMVAGPGGDAMLTRDGRFTLSPDGTLVTTAGGHAVLGGNGQPVRLDPTREANIDGDGVIRQDGVVTGSLRFVDVTDGTQLRKVGDGLLALRDGGAISDAAPTGRIHQSMVEASAVDPITTMNQLMSAAKAAQSNMRMMQFQDYLSGQAINTLGRV